MKYWIKVNFNLCWAKLSPADNISGAKETFPQQPGRGIAQGAINPAFLNLPVPESSALQQKCCSFPALLGGQVLRDRIYLFISLSPASSEPWEGTDGSAGQDQPWGALTLQKLLWGSAGVTPGWVCAASPGFCRGLGKACFAPPAAAEGTGVCSLLCSS